MTVLTSENYKTEVLDHSGPIVVLFTTPGDPETNVGFEKLEAENPKAKFATVDFETERKLVHMFSIRELPYYLYFLNGKLQEAGPSIKDIQATKED